MKNAAIILVVISLLFLLSACTDKSAEGEKTILGEKLENVLSGPGKKEDDKYTTGGMVSNNTELKPLDDNPGNLKEFSYSFCESGYRYKFDFSYENGNILNVRIRERYGEELSSELKLDDELYAELADIISESGITKLNGYDVIKSGIDPEVGELYASGAYSEGEKFSVSCNAGNYPDGWEEAHYRIVNGIKKLSGYNVSDNSGPGFEDRLLGVYFCRFSEEDDYGYTLTLLGCIDGVVFGELCEGGYSFSGIEIMSDEAQSDNSALCSIYQYSDGLGSGNWDFWDDGIEYKLELSDDGDRLTFTSDNSENASLAGLSFAKISSDALSYTVGEKTAYAEEMFNEKKIKIAALGDRMVFSAGDAGSRVYLSLREDGCFLYADFETLVCPVVYTGRYFFSEENIIFDAVRVGTFNIPILSTADYAFLSPDEVLLSDERTLDFSPSDSTLFGYLGQNVRLGFVPAD